MEQSRGFHSEKAQRTSPKKQDPQTPVKSMKKNVVQVSKNQEKSTTSPVQHKKVVNSSPKIQTLQQKTVVSEQIRIKSLQKLHYLKQCKQRKLSAEQIFQSYPFSQLQHFKFNVGLIRDQNGDFIAQIIEDQQGIHLVEEYRKNSSSKYIKQDEEENTFNGLSVSIFSNGNIFEGNYHNGHFCGVGFELHANGNTFIGNFKEGTKHGFGTYYWFANNEVYSGEWLSGLPHGEGIYIAKDKYQGNFANGLKHGFGMQNFLNGDIYVGEYVNSVADGYGEYYWSDGSIYKGDFKQGVRHGYGIWQDENEQFKGNYRLDKKQGFGIYKWKNKQVYKGQFKDDCRDGYGQLYKFGKDQKQRLLYSGCWTKGKKQLDQVVDENKIKQLYMFLEKTQKLDQVIHQTSKAKKKQKVGHKNCIPKEFSPKHKHHH